MKVAAAVSATLEERPSRDHRARGEQCQGDSQDHVFPAAGVKARPDEREEGLDSVPDDRIRDEERDCKGDTPESRADGCDARCHSQGSVAPIRRPVMP